ARESIELTELALAGPTLLDGRPPAWILHNGYHSWDESGLLPLGGKTAAGAPQRRWSWWTVGLADEAGAGLAAAGSTALSSGIRFQHTDGELFLAWCESDGLERHPTVRRCEAGAVWRTDAVRICAGDDVRAQLAGLVGGAARDPAPQGWLSWYHYGAWVSEEDVLRNAGWVAGPAQSRLGYRFVQIDDGWQQAYGDWVANSKFPGGMASLSAQLAAQGQRTGVWTAPFLVSASADLAAQAPEDWFLTDPATGERAVDPRHVVFGPMYVLDARNPAVVDHLRETHRRLHESGVTYFKIDFLYAGAHAGTAALRAGVAAIREGVGDSYILACGAPLLPLVGLVNGCRVGQDIATPVYDFEAGQPKPSIFGDELQWVARNVAARSSLAGWFQLDPDAALVGGNLSLEQGRQLVSLAALSGGPFFATDDLTALPADRLALLTNPEILELIGSGAAVPDWEPLPGDGAPTIWRLRDVVGLFNWSDAGREVGLALPGRARLRDLWQRRDLGELDPAAALLVPAHGVRLVRLATG
ncbi:MAG: alpha-galactosidase, partial [Candidatus Dormibacteraeota bacterium]|nr:alpha-galactosidase [Candidatus Dormibacteraeota bacterium]